jgi:hypothetical protein
VLREVAAWGTPEFPRERDREEWNVLWNKIEEVLREE